MSHEFVTHAALCTALVLVLGGCPSSGGGVGETCETADECRDDLQCLQMVCSPACDSHAECGDGFVCGGDGQCSQVVSSIGDACEREIDCGPGQSCVLDLFDADSDGQLAASCQSANPGAVTGSPCTTDGDCRNGTCSLGKCTDLCVGDADCPGELACVEMQRLLANSTPTFTGCLQNSGTLDVSYTLSSVPGTLRLPVPSNARSFAMVARVDDQTLTVGATRVQSPSGGILFTTPPLNDPEAYYDNPLRYSAQRAISTMLVPNTPAISLEAGVYMIDLNVLQLDGDVVPATPQINVLYKLDDSTVLDLNFIFLNLADHPCSANFDGAALNATSAQVSPRFAGYVAALREIFSSAQIVIDNITYMDMATRADLDGLRASELAALLAESTSSKGINIFFTRSVSPAGVQALIGGTPGPPNISGTPASGIAIGADTLCYREWDTVGPQSLPRITAHALARYMGLFRNREPDGHEDPIPDSDDSSDNLMYFTEYGGIELSTGQAQILRLYPGLK